MRKLFRIRRLVQIMDDYAAAIHNDVVLSILRDDRVDIDKKNVLKEFRKRYPKYNEHVANETLSAAIKRGYVHSSKEILAERLEVDSKGFFLIERVGPLKYGLLNEIFKELSPSIALIALIISVVALFI